MLEMLLALLLLIVTGISINENQVERAIKCAVVRDGYTVVNESADKWNL